ncbi:Cell fate regulator YaaT, PSP1 superfamily (controls sporulation, competence, biofilm development) [Lachnospiraceae bacterium KH1T2]|nr:Cell fate regulator YaaT, PSP1 superfamily (controls sporulation, competence, biofilm development) [Lachnospiraceae bacterium KH1T2]
MVKIICVRFRTAGKIYYFAPGDIELKKGDNVIVETARGIEFGTAVSDIMEIDEKKIVSPLKTVIRMATAEDVKTEETNRTREREAFKICLEKIRKHELEMKLIDAEYTFDGNKLLFYFTADGRIDFRELVKDLASVFRTRIELRQIGVRDETKILGGYGICGRPLCCHTFLADFSPVSIKMAKEQNLSLNPTKISGVCGRLMCCLQNEEETYEYLNKRLPVVGDIVTDKDGVSGEVQSVNILRQLVKVLVQEGDDKELREYKTDDITFQSHKKKNNNTNNNAANTPAPKEKEKDNEKDKEPEKPQGQAAGNKEKKNPAQEKQDRKKNQPEVKKERKQSEQNFKNTKDNKEQKNQRKRHDNQRGGKPQRRDKAEDKRENR